VVAGDRPIESADDDEFERVPLARRIAVEARSAPSDGGFVIGLCGRWGSGKTSVARMAIELLNEDGIMVVPFNPWMFSGHDDLVLRFFAEMTAKMGRGGGGKLKAAARRFSDYAGALAGAVRYVPAGGRTASEAITLLASLADAAAGKVDTLDDLYHELAEELRRLEERIVVFVDDIDRLADSEIRDVVRLVKSVGDLPNLTYVLAFDRPHVEAVLGGTGADEYGSPRGRAYLEKIVQSRYDIPKPRRDALVNRYLPRQLTGPLRAAGVTDGAEFLAPLARGLAGLVNTPRDVNRLANAVASAIELYAGEVAAVDLVGLEALRVLEPDVHARLDSVADILLGLDWRESFFDELEKVKRERKQRLDRLLERSTEREATRLLLRQLFPAATEYLGGGRTRSDDDQEDRDNRVAVPRIFWRYVHATIPDTEVSSAEVQDVAAALRDPQAFERAMSGYHDDRLVDMLRRLSGYWEGFDPAVIVPLGAVLLAVGNRLTDDDSPFRMRTEPATWQFERMLGRLLISEPDLRQRAENVRRLVRRAPNLIEHLALAVWFGTFPQRTERDSEREMLDEKQTSTEMSALRREILAASAATLASEIETSMLLGEVLLENPSQARRALAAKASDPGFLLVLLRECTIAVHSGTRTRYEFHWRQFVNTLGDEPAREAIIAFSSGVGPDDYDERTREGLRQALAIARGEAEPTTLFDRPDP